jgi:intracellular sulfur oxidation DsrE/DsrF family protein
MKCLEAIRLLDAHVDDELEVTGLLALEEHLGQCARCRAREESMRALRAALQRHTEFRVAPASLRSRMSADTQSNEMPGRRRLALGAAGLGVLGLVGILSWQIGSKQTIVRGERKVIYHLTDSRTASAALRTLGNHLQASPATRVVVVAHNDGVDFLLRGARDEAGQLYETAVQHFRQRGVEFRVCTNTLVRRKIEATGIVAEATLVRSGIEEVERLQQQEGYSYLRM